MTADKIGCAACLAGTFEDEDEAPHLADGATQNPARVTCKSCPAHWHVGAGEAACEACPAGYDAASTGSAACAQCPAGWATRVYAIPTPNNPKNNCLLFPESRCGWEFFIRRSLLHTPFWASQSQRL